MMTKTYESLCKMLEKEIDNIEMTKTITKESLDLLKCLTEALKNVKHLMKEEEEKENPGMSGHMPYYEGMSGARRRDSMGRYMDHDPNLMMEESMRGGYARDGYAREEAYAARGESYARGNNRSREYRDSSGYSRDDARKKMVRKLETLMDDTMSEHEREAIQDCISKIE